MWWLRITALLILLGSGLETKAQPNDSVRVVYAKNVNLGDGQPVFTLDWLNKRNVVSLRKGALILVDGLGQLVEHTGRGEVKLGDLFEDDSVRSVGPLPVEFLFDTLRPNRIYGSGAVPASIDDLVLSYPNRHFVPMAGNVFDGQYYRASSACLRWRVTYHLYQDSIPSMRVTTPFYEPISEPIRPKGYQAEMDLSDYKEQVAVVVRFITRSWDDLYAPYIYDPEIRIVTPCNAKSSVEYLQIAMQFELVGEFQGALEYYEKAAGSSKIEFYQFVLEDFRKRIRGIDITSNY